MGASEYGFSMGGSPWLLPQHGDFHTSYEKEIIRLPIQTKHIEDARFANHGNTPDRALTKVLDANYSKNRS